MIRILVVLALTISALTFVGCASGHYHEGRALLDEGRYEEAVELLRLAMADDPEKVEVWRELGMAYFHLGEYEQASQAFKQVALLDPTDERTVLYRGMIHEELGELAQAQRLYESYLAYGTNKKIRHEVRYRLRWVTDTHLQQIIDAAVAGENQIEVATIPKNSLAVLRFDATSLPERLRPLGRGMAELIYHDLSYVKGIDLVERLEISRLRQELALSESEYSDKMTSPRVGKIVGARKIVTGKIVEPKTDRVSIDCGIVDVGPGVTEYPEPQSGEVKRFFQMQKQLTFEIIKDLGYDLTPEIRGQIEKLPTESLLALMAFSRGLDYADRGLYALAEAEFKVALAEDPGFSLADAALQEYGGLADYTGQLRPLDQVLAVVESELTERDMQRDQRFDVLKRLQSENANGISNEDNPYVAPQV
ncbi:MAG: tetratricopeptide repeat protein, partial [bacterium]